LLRRFMKTVYFVRHGQSEGNAGDFHQGPATPITEKGRTQAQFIAERCVTLPIEAVISSAMKRTRETAHVIAKKINKPLESSDLFVERRRPAEQLDRPTNDPEAVRISKILRENFTVPGYRYSNEENFDDLKARAQMALAYLEKRPEKNILVVTHGLFLRALLSVVVFGKELTAREFLKMSDAFYTENTGMTVLCLEEHENKPPEWWVWIWNDHAHLG